MLSPPNATWVEKQADLFVEYYNTTRSSMVRDHLPPVRAVPESMETLKLDQIEVKSHVGGLVKSFDRKAA